MSVTDLTYVEVNRGAALNIRAHGWATSAALVVLFVVCDLLALIWPDIAATHAWVSLLTLADAGSLRSFAEGVLWSLLFGWVVAIVFGAVYNRVAASAAMRD